MPRSPSTRSASAGWRRSGLLRAALPAICLVAAGPAPAQEMREISGSVTYRQRIALPPEAEVTLRLTDADGAEVMRDSLDTGGRQVPIDFLFGAPQGALVLEAGISAGGAPLWAADPVEIPEGEEPVALGPILLHPMPAEHVWTCGGHLISLRFDGERARMETGGAVYDLAQTVTASGARYEAKGDPGTWIWNKGVDLTASLKGEELPGCTPAGAEAPTDAGAQAGGAVPLLTARGNEPGWRIDIAEGQLRLRLVDGTDETRPLPEPALEQGARRYRLDNGDELLLVHRPCRDSMTGMPFPGTAQLTKGGQQMQGCAGDPQDLLTGPEWQVEDILGGGIIDRSHVTIAFEDGRAAGSAGCNRWFAEAKLTGEGLSFGAAGATMMACADALMAQERRFLDALERVTGFDIDETGALLLQAGGETVIKARR